MKITVRNCSKVTAHDHGPDCDCPKCRSMKDVKGSVTVLDDDEDYEADVPSDYARDVIYEVADIIGAESTLDSIVRWFSSWDLVPVANDLLNDNGLKFEED